MRSANSVNWNLLLDSKSCLTNLMQKWSESDVTTREVVDKLSHTEFAGEFRKLVRNNGTNYARRLARKALKYRGVTV
jgi:hypothetical protein